jgi:uncharacterized membrane protein
VTPIFLSYVLSFLYVAIYWNNRHHFFNLVRHVDGLLLWTNLHLLFGLSLVLFTTGWMGENSFAPLATATYGLSLLMPALTWSGMQAAIIRIEGNQSALARAIGRDLKDKMSPFLYATGIGSAFVDTRIANAIYALVALIWLVPDRRIERTVSH